MFDSSGREERATYPRTSGTTEDAAFVFTTENAENAEPFRY